MPRIGCGFLCKQYMYKSSKSPFNTGRPGNPDSRSPIFHYNCLNPGSVRELPLPAPQLLSKQESGLEGGRKVYVDLTTFVGPDAELYMTEYVAIRIVFTLQGLYICTHSPRIQSGISRLSLRHQSTKLTATSPSYSRSGARPPAVGRPGL